MLPCVSTRLEKVGEIPPLVKTRQMLNRKRGYLHWEVIVLHKIIMDETRNYGHLYLAYVSTRRLEKFNYKKVTKSFNDKAVVLGLTNDAQEGSGFHF